jgi:predicted RNA-binding protein (virulence factor B family)
VIVVSLGKICELEILSKSDQCLVLVGAEFGELWLPISEAPNDSEIGMLIEVFVYRPSADEIAVTTKRPIAEVGDCGFAWKNL